MIVSDRYRFVYMHIPKCAGTSVRATLCALDERRDDYYDREIDMHDVLGPLDYRHIPLKVLRDHFRDDYERVTRYRSFAVIRNPYERFRSSIWQNIRRVKMLDHAGLSADELTRQMDEVMEILSGIRSGEPIIDPQLIHFGRQVDYVQLNGEQIVRQLYDIGELEHLFRDLELVIGAPLSRPKSDNQQHMSFKSHRLRRIDAAVQPVIMQNLPRSVWKPLFVSVREALRIAGLVNKWSNVHDDVFASRRVKRFISSFYEQDIALHRSVQQRGTAAQCRG